MFRLTANPRSGKAAVWVRLCYRSSPARDGSSCIWDNLVSLFLYTQRSCRLVFHLYIQSLVNPHRAASEAVTLTLMLVDKLYLQLNSWINLKSSWFVLKLLWYCSCCSDLDIEWPNSFSPVGRTAIVIYSTFPTAASQKSLSNSKPVGGFSCKTDAKSVTKHSNHLPMRYSTYLDLHLDLNLHHSFAFCSRNLHSTGKQYQKKI